MKVYWRYAQSLPLCKGEATPVNKFTKKMTKLLDCLLSLKSLNRSETAFIERRKPLLLAHFQVSSPHFISFPANDVTGSNLARTHNNETRKYNCWLTSIWYSSSCASISDRGTGSSHFLQRMRFLTQWVWCITKLIAGIPRLLREKTNRGNVHESSDWDLRFTGQTLFIFFQIFQKTDIPLVFLHIYSTMNIQQFYCNKIYWIPKCHDVFTLFYSRSHSASTTVLAEEKSTIFMQIFFQI